MGSSEKRKREGTDAEVSKKAKKDKKDKKAAAAAAVVEAPAAVAMDVDSDADEDDVDATMLSTVSATNGTKPKTVLVPFANPLATDKTLKKVLKSTKKESRKAAKAKTLKRGVKEVVKAINKSASLTTKDATAVAVFAADIWPMDVISHMPVLCEEKNIPYVFVDSRAELGRASGTKRPTSVVMVTKQAVAKGKKDDDGDWPETYSDLLKTVLKANKAVKV